MQVFPTSIPDVVEILPRVFGDERGFFFESWNAQAFAHAGIPDAFVQDNHSRSLRNVLRGLHYQVKHAQGKLIRALAGEVYDVAVDLRCTSPTFGKWVSLVLSAERKNMLWVPPGFAHGFCVVSEYAEVFYKATDYYAPEHERTLLWSDAQLAIPWPVQGAPIVSPKDAAGTPFAEAEFYP